MSPTAHEPGAAPVADDFVLLRTPLLSFDELLEWSAGVEAPAAPEPLRGEAVRRDRALLRSRLELALERPEVREALWLASPDLVRAWDEARARSADLPDRVVLALARYYQRMAARPTPFGLFAGCSLAELGDGTNLRLVERARYTRRTRLDNDYLSRLAAVLASDPDLRGRLVYRANSSLYRAAGRCWYAEARVEKNDTRSYRLSAVDATEPLELVLGHVVDGATPAAIVERLLEWDPEIARDEAEEYVQALIDEQVLVPELEPPVTGGEALAVLIDDLVNSAGSPIVIEHLRETRADLARFDCAGPGAGLEGYRTVIERLRELPARVEEGHAFQVDLWKPVEAAIVDRAVVDDIVRAIEAARLCSNAGRDTLSAFREAFHTRFEDREVPLLEALDDEVGIGLAGFDQPDGDTSTLLEHLPIPGGAAERRIPWEAREQMLARLLCETASRGATSVELTAVDLDPLRGHTLPRLPESFSVGGAIGIGVDAAGAGRHQVFFGAVWGPSAACPLGRFCDANPELESRVRKHLRIEEAHSPDAIYAEIVHLPEGRLGNVLFRPVLRDYEIPYLGRSGAPRDRQIPLDDLLLSLRGDRLVLRSRRLDREVIPRLSTAHNFSIRSLPAYRFLCRIQAQHVAGSVGWTWAPFNDLPFLPRVTLGSVILAPGQWYLGKQDLAPLIEADADERFARARAWAVERRIPRFVLFSEGDNQLPVDFDNALSIDVLVDLLRKREQATLVEMPIPPESLVARGPEGRYVSEFIMSFHADLGRPTAVGVRKSALPRVARRFPPGSEWLYARIYTGASCADRVLSQVVRPVTRRAIEAGDADQWFFIRYSSGGWQIRLRLHGDPQRLLERVLPDLHGRLEPLMARGDVWKLQLDTYEPEVDRYGGDDGIPLAQQIFHADSEAVLDLMELLDGDSRGDARWRIALCSVVALFDDFGLATRPRIEIATLSRDLFADSLGDLKPLWVALGDRFRRERTGLERLLAHESDTIPAEVWAILARRSQRIRPMVGEILAGIAERHIGEGKPNLVVSYAHMHLNRLLRSRHSHYEIVLNDFLVRLYESKTARERRRTPDARTVPDLAPVTG